MRSTPSNPSDWTATALGSAKTALMTRFLKVVFAVLSCFELFLGVFWGN
jgi:hypothetical protein